MGFNIIYSDPAKNLVESIALFEAGVASLIVSESDLLDKFIERNEESKIFLKANSQIISIICCLKGLEEAVAEILKEET